MQITNELLFKIAVSVLAFIGFWVARRIHQHKKTGAPLVCPIKFDCQSVVHSDYSKFLGLPVERVGMMYYMLASIGYFILIFLSQVHIILIGILVLLSLVAFLFSIYLICVQIFILKKGCSWCFVSAFICILIFILNLYIYNLGFIVNSLF